MQWSICFNGYLEGTNTMTVIAARWWRALLRCVAHAIGEADVHRLPCAMDETAGERKGKRWGFHRQELPWTIKTSGNVGIAIVNFPFLMVYTNHLWRLGGWCIIAIPTYQHYTPLTIRSQAFYWNIREGVSDETMIFLGPKMVDWSWFASLNWESGDEPTRRL